MVVASPRTRARMVISLAPRARAVRAELWPITCRARSRSRVPPASTRARDTLRLIGRATAVVLLVACRPGARLWILAGVSWLAVLMSALPPRPGDRAAGRG